METINKTTEDLQKELEDLRYQLAEANDTIEAIRTGQVDALVVQGENGHQLYTLKTADHSYRLFIEKMTEGAVTLDRQGIILYCNSHFAEMVNQPLSQVIGLSFEKFIASENVLNYNLLFEKCWEDDCKGEVCLVTGHHQTPVQLSLTTLELDEGVSLSIILTDLTVQKETQKQLQDNNIQLEKTNRALASSNHDLQQFASIASHDLQEPLRKIQVFAHLMKEKAAGLNNDAVIHLQKIIDSSARMKTLVIDILNYSKLSASDIHTEPVDLNKVIGELLDDFELIIAEKKATLTFDILPTLDVNREQVSQVFHNIIGNALKFSKPGIPPVIAVKSKMIAEKSFSAAESADGVFCLINIKDNGIGFEEKYVQHIFSLFERLNSKDKFEGTGIGLAIAKKIIEKHNGLIRASSSEGNGAEFQLILPVSQNTNTKLL